MEIGPDLVELPMVACGLATWAAVMHRPPEDLALHCAFLHHHPLCVEMQLCVQDAGALRHRDRGLQVVVCPHAPVDAGSEEFVIAGAILG